VRRTPECKSHYNTTVPDTSIIDVFLGSSGAIGALVSVATFAASWLHDRSAAARNREDIASLQVRATFWKTWIEAQRLTGLSEGQMDMAQQVARTELESLSDLMREIGSQKAKEHQDGVRSKAAVGPLRRFFLLYRPPRSAWIWALRIFFYYWLIAPVFFVVLFSWVTPDAPLGVNEVSFLTMLSWIFALAVKWAVLTLERRKLARSPK
jgi:hypothetical protein